MITFMKKNSRFNKKPKQPSVDGFVRRNPRETDVFGQKLSHNRISAAHRPSKNSQDLFNQPEGFNAALRTGKEKLPDGTQTGRKPLKKSDLDLGMDITGNSGNKKRLGKKRDWRRISKKSAISFVVGVAVLGLLILGILYWRARQVFNGGEKALGLNCDVDPALLQNEGDGRVNVLILGKGGPGHEGADLTDTIMVASLDACQKEVGLLSIPRDLYVEMKDVDSMKINTVYPTAKERAFAEGKTEKEAEKIAIGETEKVIEEVTSLPIHYHAMVDFKAFQKAIDTVGGVDVNVPEALYDQTVAWKNNNDPLIADVGVQHMKGEKALLYARSRYGSARGDFDRAERQKQVLVALRQKIFSLGTFGNPIKISQLLGAFGDHVQTNLSIDDLMKIYDIGQEIGDDKVKSIGLADPPNEFLTTDTYYGLSVVVPKAGLYNYDEIQAFLRNQLRDGFLKKEDARVAVLNGTKSPNLAKDYAKMLKSYGYNVTEVGNAPDRNTAQTTLYDTTKGDKKYTKRYLELRTRSTALDDLPSGINGETADFVIIIGEN